MSFMPITNTTKFIGATMPFTTLRESGRIIIPKRLREKLKMKIGDRFEVKENKGQIILMPTSTHQTWNWTDDWTKKVEIALKEVDEGNTSKAYDNLESALVALKKKV